MDTAHGATPDHHPVLGVPHPETPAVIRDEAAPTPLWIPLLGAALFVVTALLGQWYRVSHREADTTKEVQQAAVQVEPPQATP